MAAKKTAAKKTSTAEVSTVSKDEGPGISPELVEARDAQVKAEVDAGLKNANGGLVETEVEIGLDPALAEAREKALKAEKNRKTY